MCHVARYSGRALYLTNALDAELFTNGGAYPPFATGCPDPNATLWTIVGLAVLLLLLGASIRCVRNLKAAEMKADASWSRRPATPKRKMLL